MICYLCRGRPLLAVGLLLAFAGLAHALIGVAFPLSAMVDESEWIAVAKVERIDRQAPLVVLSVSEDLKGKAIDRRLVIDFKGDWYAKIVFHPQRSPSGSERDRAGNSAGTGNQRLREFEVENSGVREVP